MQGIIPGYDGSATTTTREFGEPTEWARDRT